jgi:hypothetical protein
MASGSHIPEYGFGDTGGGLIIDYGFGSGSTGVPTTPGPTTPAPSTPAPSTESPITADPGPTILGTRIGGTFVYRPGERRLIGRCWAELENKHIATRSLQAALCKMRLIEEDGSFVTIDGRSDSIDHHRVIFLLKNFTPLLNHAYRARVVLVTAAGDVIGVRTFRLAVN